jgi:hypothetical protein
MQTPCTSCKTIFITSTVIYQGRHLALICYKMLTNFFSHIFYLLSLTTIRVQYLGINKNENEGAWEGYYV